MLNDAWTASKHLVPKVGGVAGSTVARVRDEHFLKQWASKIVTLSGIVIEVRDEQLLKQLFPKLVTPSGIVIKVRDEQP